jgi:hypothetical protein
MAEQSPHRRLLPYVFADSRGKDEIAAQFDQLCGHLAGR